MVNRLTGKSLTAGLMYLCACTPVWSADIYDIDPKHTASAFEYNHWGLSRQRGQFNATSGYIEFDPESKAAHIRIEIDASSVNTGTEAFNEVLRSPDFFDTENYPKIFFKSFRVQFEEERMTEVEGNLTIKDITRPMVLKLSHFHCRFMLIYGARACGANASARILRSDFNPGRFTSFVGDEIDLHITVEAIMRNPPQVEQPDFFKE